MDLLSLLDSTPELRELSDEFDIDGILEILNSKSIPHEKHDLQTCWGFADLYPDYFKRLMDVLEIAADSDSRFRAAKNAFENRGLDLGNEKMQQNIAALQMFGLEPEICTALLEMGVWHTTPCEESNLSPATKESVQEALNRRSMQFLRSELGLRYNLLIEAIDRGEITSVAEGKTFFASED